MNSYIKKHILNGLKSINPNFDENQMVLNLQRSSLNLEDLDFERQIDVEGFKIIINVKIAHIGIKMDWRQLFTAPLQIDLKSLKIHIKEISKSEPKQIEKSEQTIWEQMLQNFLINSTVSIIDFEVQVLDELYVQFQELKMQNIMKIGGSIFINKFIFQHQITITIDYINAIKQVDNFKIQIEHIYAYHEKQHLLNINKNNITLYDNKLDVQVFGALCVFDAVLLKSQIDILKDLMKLKPQEPKVQQKIHKDFFVNIQGEDVQLLFKNRNVCVGQVTAKFVETVIQLLPRHQKVQIITRETIYKDNSNYPFTISEFSKQGYNLIENKELIIDLLLLDNDYENIIDSTINFVVVTLNNSKLLYVQQPFLRFLDFLIEQFLAFCINDFEIKSDDIELWINKIKYPKFTSVKLIFNNIEAQIKPVSMFEESLKLKVKSVNINQGWHMSKTRKVQYFDYMWESIFTINAQDIIIFNQEQLSNKLNINVTLYKSHFSLNYNMAKLEYDRTIKLIIECNPISLKIQKPDYNLIMQCLLNNVFFDDAQDPVYMYRINKQTPLDVKFICEQVQLDIKGMQKTVIKLQDFVLLYDRLNYVANINLQGSNLNADFESEIQTNILFTRELKFKQLNNSDGNKQISVEIQQAKTEFNLEWLFTLINFFVLDDCSNIYAIFNPKTIDLEVIIHEIDAQVQKSFLECDFTGKGNLVIIFNKNPHENNHTLYHEIKEHMGNSCLRVESSNLQLYTGDRNVLQKPISVQWKSQNCLCNCDQSIYLNDSKLSIDNLQLILNVEELMSLIDTVKHQVKSMWMADQFQNEIDWQNVYKQCQSSRKQFKIDLLEILITYQEQSHIPLALIQIQFPQFYLLQSFQKLLLSMNFLIEISSFNHNATILEPILEKISLDLLFSKDVNNCKNLIVEVNKQSKYQQLNLNINQQFFQIVMQLLRQNKPIHHRKTSKLSSVCRFEQLEQNSNQMLLFNVKNLSGYPLQIIFNSGSYIVDNEQTEEVTIDFSLFGQVKQLQIEFQDKSGVSINIPNIKIDRKSIQQWGVKKYQKFYIQNHQKQLKRELIISSPLIIKNCTNQKVYLYIFYMEQMIERIDTNSYSKYPINPTYLSENYFFALSTNNQLIYQTTPLLSLMEKNHMMIFVNQYQFFNVQLSEISSTENFLKFDIKFPISIINHIPIPIVIDFKQKFILIISKQDYWIQPKEKLELHTNIQQRAQLLGMKIKKYILEDQLLLNLDDKLQQYSEILTLKKSNSKILKIKQFQILNNNQLIIHFYCQELLLNLSGYQLKFYGIHDKKQSKISKLDDKIYIINDEKKILLEYEQFQSEDMSIVGLGETSLQVKKLDQQVCSLYEFGVNVWIKSIYKNQLFTKLVEISPRYVLANETSLQLQIQQEDTYAQPNQIGPRQRFSVFWNDCRKEKNLVVRVLDTNPTRWSGGIQVFETRTVHFYCQDKLFGKKYFMKSITNKMNQTFYIQIMEEDPPYVLINKSTKHKIYISQINQQIYEFSLEQNQSVDFSWPSPCLDPILNIKIQDQQPTLIDLSHTEFNYYLPNDQDRLIFLKIEIVKSQKIITFYDIEDIPVLIEAINDQQEFIYVKIPLTTISLIQSKPQPIELNLITICDMELGYEKSSEERSYQMKIKFINVDCNHSYKPYFQVLLTPKIFNMQSSDPFLNFKMRVKSFDQHISIIEYFNIYITPLVVTLEEEYLYLILAYINSFQFFRKKENINAEEYVFGNLNYQQQFPHQEPFEDWKYKQLPTPVQQIHIKTLLMPLLDLTLSFQRGFQQRSFVFNVILKYIGAALTNIEDAPIKLKGVKIENVFDTTMGLFLQIKQHYIYALVTQFLRILGSFELIGSPTFFFSRLSTAVIDIFEKPIQGFQKGPLELGLGILEGTASLVKNTVAGTFNSLNKITGSVANNLSILSMDEEYLNRRRLIMSQRPIFLIDGIYIGVQAFLYGLGDGIYGIIMQPYQEARRDGLVGILSGSAKGIAGLIVKPITGVLDTASKTAEGLKNSAQYFDDKPNTHRLRDIRVFYEPQKYIRPFNEDDSYFQTLFQSLKGGLYKKLTFLDNFCLQDLELNRGIYLLMYYEYIFYIDKDGRIYWSLKSKDLQEFKLFQDPRDQNMVRLSFQITVYNYIYQTGQLRIKFQKVPYLKQISQRLDYLLDINK